MIKSCIGKANVPYAKCSHCQNQIRRGAWIVAFKDERLVVHQKCYEPAVAKIELLRSALT